MGSDLYYYSGTVKLLIESAMIKFIQLEQNDQKSLLTLNSRIYV